MGGGGPLIGWPRIYRSCSHMVREGRKEKMYKIIIFINFISRSKKLKSKMLHCV
jgi:hypothetical protein